MIKWKLEQRRLGDLVPYENNPRHRNEEGYKQLAQSIAAIGLASVPNITQNNTILSGHQRVALLTETAGPDHVIDVYVADHALDSKEMQDVVIWLNKAIAGDWNMDFIEEHFDDMDFGKYGFDAPKKGKIDDDDVHSLPTIPKSKRGDLYILGNHRVLCGDSTSDEDVARLMDGKKADMVFTDPPYGVDYVGGHFHSGDVNIKREREKLIGDQDDSIYLKCCEIITKFVDGPAYTFFADTKPFGIFDAIRATGGELHALLIWNKINATYAAMNAQYKQRHEPFLYWKPKGSRTLRWIGDSKEATIWEIKKDGRNKLHPTQKPVELAMRAIKNHEKGIVLDLFLGSGSTLIAAEKLGRICFGMELDPHYIDVVIKRWEEFTGKKAVKQ